MLHIVIRYIANVQILITAAVRRFHVGISEYTLIFHLLVCS